MSMQPRRVRLKPWLLAQVDSGRFPGLHWLNAERRLFQIPWKHATRHTPTCEDDNTVFKAWALETGKFQEGVDEPDPAKWKANLRCALNKSREFQLKFDGTKEMPVEAYKIYEVVCTDATADDDEIPNLTELTIDSRIRDSGSVTSLPPPPSDLSQFCASTSETFARFHPLTSEPMLDGMNLDHTPNEACAVVQGHVVDPPNLLSSIPLTDLDLKFQYRGRAMGSLTVSNPQGCRLYYGQLEPNPEQVELFGPVTLQQVRFPGTSEILSQKQREFTEALLNVMDRGLILEIWEQDIYALRLCQCKVFWSGPGVPDQGQPNRLERERRVRVFSLNDFLQGLILYQKGEVPNAPPFEICFCFGEDWPDMRPKEKKLIVVQVVPVVARILTEMFSGEQSWSIDSIRLQISIPDVKDQTVEQFKELQRLLQSQHVHAHWTDTVP
ncbi:interferon regulatory factor 5 [Nerophis ophidion]|uniref:interferon regulatory factor 5 n=1 Tax=Nerophis ophidion TaxID=159077 RepID=UPI002AE04037|nr:interferon regulatory factor 5 [Nerophis ophidion]XP_061768034.1 interferon regulatory factor 5 [Nerophis ophidion]